MTQRPDPLSSQEQPFSSPNPETPGWIDEELAACSLPDQRWREGWQQLRPPLSSGLGERIPLACQDGANTKAAYRFLANPRVSEEGIWAGHWPATRSRFAAATTPILILHETTGFPWARQERAPLGMTHQSFRPAGRSGIAQATVLNCSVGHSKSALMFCCEPVRTAGPKRGAAAWQR